MSLIGTYFVVHNSNTNKQSEQTINEPKNNNLTDCNELYDKYKSCKTTNAYEEYQLCINKTKKDDYLSCLIKFFYMGIVS
jgi:hypothetical protein